MKGHTHDWIPLPGFEEFPHRLCKCGALKVRESLIGQNTISLSPGGTDVARWSASQDPIATGDIGMEATTGRPRFFRAAAVRDVAGLDDIPANSNVFAATRVVSSVAGEGTDLTLAAALAALPTEGGTIFVKGGTYSITATMTLPLKNVKIIGAGGNFAENGTPDAVVFDLGTNAIALFTMPAGSGGSYYFSDFMVVGDATAAQQFIDVPVAAGTGSSICERLRVEDVQDIVRTNGQDVYVTFRNCDLAPATATASFWNSPGPDGELYWEYIHAEVPASGTTNAISGAPLWSVLSSYLGGPPPVTPSIVDVGTIQWIDFHLGNTGTDAWEITVSGNLSQIISSELRNVSLVFAANVFLVSNSWFFSAANAGDSSITLDGTTEEADSYISNCRFDGDSVALWGVDVIETGIGAVISGCTFAGHSGGGVRVAGSGTPASAQLSIIGCRFNESGSAFTETTATVQGRYEGNFGLDSYTILSATSIINNWNTRSITTTPVTLDETHKTALVDATGGARVVNLPTAASAFYRVYTIKKVDATANTVTIDGSGAETIDGAATVVLTTQWERITIQSNGTAWFRID